jgi:predicted lipoprotein with Yx(FWY)xxD motif
MKARLALAGAAAVALLGGCGTHSPSLDTAAEPTLQVQDEPGFGPLVTDASGAAFYLYTADARRRATCVGSCAVNWVPLVVPDGATGQAGVGVEARLIGTVPRPGGGRQITYGGWPLYTYLGDRTTFSVTGNGRRVGGGTFHPVTPSGHAASPRQV